MVVTSIEKVAGDPEQYLIYIDGERSFTVSEELYFKLNLYEQKEISAQDIAFIDRKAHSMSARQAAIRFLSSKLRCGSEVRSKLAMLGYESAVIEETINELKGLGYINDELYVQKYIYDRSKLKPQSKKLLKFDLLKKGIDGNIIDVALEQLKMDEEMVAAYLLKKKYGKQSLEDEKTKRKARQFLYRRGFEGDMIEKVLCREDRE